MAKIHKLDDALSNKIAAGEVVERPASIVKELVENALDAGSSTILVEMEEGGLRSIRVVDNGSGIETEDVETAFLRHATSKIRLDRDLFKIKTLGFRGEALPSIASVSRVEFQTSTGEGAGVKLLLQGGELLERTPAEARRGTSITVTDLFYNTPARLKYLKTVLTESGHVSDVMNRQALAHPDVAFHYVHDGKTVLKTSGNGDLRQVIAEIYGRQVASAMQKVEGESLDYSVTGYVAKPEVTRANRQYMSIFINGRYIRNYMLANAIQKGFHTLLPIGRFPIAVLLIEMDPALIDVNVHPAKLEVRLSKEDALSELVISAIKETFAKMTLIPEAAAPKPKTTQSEQMSLSFEEKPAVQKNERPSPMTHDLTRESQPPLQSSATESPPKKEVPAPEEPQEQAENQDVGVESVSEEELVHLEPIATVDKEDEKKETTTVRSAMVPTLYPVGQMHGTYIIAQNENGMYLVDQHAAQERIKYEFYREKVTEVEPQTQMMLVPLTIELTARESAIIIEHQAKLEAVGVFLEPFGKHTYMVRSHPVWFPKGEEEETIREMVGQLITTKTISLAQLREAAAILMSCKAAIKANRHLRHDEVFSLLETLRHCEEPFTCPHGRPVIIHFSTYELEKMFKRVM
ncbi:DNA mismatch repair endonuclease MutL [Shouchella shacheensis]|uniref:DNA mismatch repair endonuclease MutL n=1 Tax=Shouchella shacheensis TaxID=1649580 RepID=UPI00073FABE8|nr:DNA mismatch repair endonuclease MutL [Shouchella shacheensis]